MSFQAPYNVMRYSLAPDVDDTIKEYFEIDPETGIIFLQKSLMLDSEGTKEYGVSTKSSKNLFLPKAVLDESCC